MQPQRGACYERKPSTEHGPGLDAKKSPRERRMWFTMAAKIFLKIEDVVDLNATTDFYQSQKSMAYCEAR